MTGEPGRTTGWADAGDRLSLATDVVSLLRERRETLATAESLTGGLVAAALTDVVGSSAVIRGGIVAYATDVKRDVLTVDADVLNRQGAVSAAVAVEMAVRAGDLFASSWSVSTTGVAGPERQDGQPVGTVYVAVAGPDMPGSPGRVSNVDAVESGVEDMVGAALGVETMTLALTGSRSEIRGLTVVHALQMLRDRIAAAQGDV